MQGLAGMNDREDRVGGDGGFAEALQDQLQLAGIGGDVADREDAW